MLNTSYEMIEHGRDNFLIIWQPYIGNDDFIKKYLIFFKEATEFCNLIKF